MKTGSFHTSIKAPKQFGGTKYFQTKRKSPLGRENEAETTKHKGDFAVGASVRLAAKFRTTRPSYITRNRPKNLPAQNTPTPA